MPLQLDPTDLEAFDRRMTLTRSGKAKTATITKNGLLSLSDSASKIIGSPKAVELLYGRRQNVIAFKPASEDDPGAFPLRPQGKNATTSTVSAKTFLEHYDIPVGISRRYEVELVDGMLVVDLNTPGIPVTSNRNRNKSGENGAAAKAAE